MQQQSQSSSCDDLTSASEVVVVSEQSQLNLAFEPISEKQKHQHVSKDKPIIKEFTKCIMKSDTQQNICLLKYKAKAPSHDVAFGYTLEDSEEEIKRREKFFSSFFIHHKFNDKNNSRNTTLEVFPEFDN